MILIRLLYSNAHTLSKHSVEAALLTLLERCGEGFTYCYGVNKAYKCTQFLLVIVYNTV